MDDIRYNLIETQIWDYIASNDKLEVFYVFTRELMSEAFFKERKFSRSFQKGWFTYEEYKKYWEEVHWQLSFHWKAYLLSLDIITTDLLTLEDFTDENKYEQLRDDLLSERLSCAEERKIIEQINRPFGVRNCLIFNFYSTRSYKLDYQDDNEKTVSMLEYYYRRCVCDTLFHSIDFGLYFGELLPLMRELEGIKNPINSINCNPCHDKEKENRISLEEDGVVNTSDIKLPQISGEYVEAFQYPYGKLHISSNTASIQFYFPGPDARYRGTFVFIAEEQLDNYIKAYINNWKRGQELHLKAKDVPHAELKEYGEMGMSIVAKKSGYTVYLQSYHLPISSQKEFEDIILQLRRAKLRIQEVRAKLFV